MDPAKKPVSRLVKYVGGFLTLVFLLGFIGQLIGSKNKSEVIMPFIGMAVLVAVVYYLNTLNEQSKARITAKEKMMNTIICPNTNCGFKGEAIKTKRANTGLGVLLCLFFLLPGILYFMFKSGYRYTCPQCGLLIRTDN